MTGGGNFAALLVAVGEPGVAASGFDGRAGLTIGGSGAVSTVPAAAPAIAAATFLAGGRSGCLGAGVAAATGTGGGSAAITRLARTGAGPAGAAGPAAAPAGGVTFRSSR